MIWKKVGRNDPCPCGSGKKYKRCCYLTHTNRNSHNLGNSIPANLLTGTKLDDYLKAFNIVSAYGSTLMSKGEYKEILKSDYEDMINRYKPGTRYGLNDSTVMNWFFLDLRFGTYQKTITETFLEEKTSKHLIESDRVKLQQLANSYVTCYVIQEVNQEFIRFEELGTKKVWKVISTDEPYQHDARPGLIWYARFVGTREEAYCFGDPYVFPPTVRKDFQKIVLGQVKSFEKYVKTRSLSFDIFRDSCKAASAFWAEYLYRGMNPDELEEESLLQPIINTTDGEKLRFCTIYFKIKNKEGLREKLSCLRNFEYDKGEQSWIWFKKGNKNKTFERIILGHVTIRDNYLIGELNSLERALKLKNKLMVGGFKSILEYDKIEGRDLHSMEKPTEAEMKKYEKEQKMMHSDPALGKFMKQKYEDYYLKDWVSQKIPALDNISPKQAAKTNEGRLKLEVLVNRMEKMQDNQPDYTAKMDFNVLREMLGLPS